MCSGSEAGSYLRRIDSCINLQDQGPFKTYNESEEEEEAAALRDPCSRAGLWRRGPGKAPARLGWRSCQVQTVTPKYFTEMCSGSVAGSYLRRIDFVHHSTLGLRVLNKKKKKKKKKSPPQTVSGHHARMSAPYSC